MNYQIDELERRPPPRSNFLRNFIVVSFVLSVCLFFAYQKGALPHYTLVIDGNKWEWVRDDPAYLAEQFLKAQPEGIQQDPAVLPELVEVHGLPEQPPVHSESSDIKKCKSSSGRIVYQDVSCVSMGMVEVQREF